MNSKVEKTRGIYYQILAENEISWQTQSKIHRLLNETYAGVSSSFLAKTYSKSIPQQRILLFKNEELIGHLGLFKRYLISNAKEIPFFGIGLIAVSKVTPGFGLALLRWGLAEIKKSNIDFAVGISSNPTVIQLSKILRAKIYKARLVANGIDSTKDTDYIIFYPIKNSNNTIDIIDSANIGNTFKIVGGSVF